LPILKGKPIKRLAAIHCEALNAQYLQRQKGRYCANNFAALQMLALVF